MSFWLYSSSHKITRVRLKNKTTRNHVQGFTLLEIVFVVVIIGIITSVLLVGYPSSRDAQTLTLAEQQLQATIRDAEKRAINEERPEECLNRFPAVNIEDRRRCSDVGVYATDKFLKIFSDTNGNLEYDSGEFAAPAQKLPGAAAISGQHNILWRGSPPVIEIYHNGQLLQSPDNPAEIKLRAGRSEITLLIHPYGYITRKP